MKVVVVVCVLVGAARASTLRSAVVSLASKRKPPAGPPMYKYNCSGRFAFCGMASCALTPVGQLAACQCWVGHGESIAPGPKTGAQTTNQTDLCVKMETALYSTAPKNASQSVPAAPAAQIVMCPVQTPFAYCWGAACDAPNASGMTTCYCPVIRSKKVPGSNQQMALVIPASMCGATDAGRPVDYCDSRNYTFNSGPSAMITAGLDLATASVCDINSDPRHYNFEPEAKALGSKFTDEVEALVKKAVAMGEQLANEAASHFQPSLGRI